MDNTYVALIVAGLACFAITAFVVTFSWLFIIMFWLPRMEETLASKMLIGYSFFLIVWAILQGVWTVPAALWTAALSFLATLRTNLFYIFALTLVCSGGYVWLDYHPTIVSNYLYFRQTSRPVVDFFLLPVINLLRMIFDAFIPVVNFWTNLYAFYEYGLPITLFKCGLNTELANVFAYGANFLYAAFFDFSIFFAGDFFHDQWSLLNSLNALGLLFDTWIPIFDCLCLALNFLWVYIATFFQLPSLHAAVNFAWNWAIALVQLAFNLVMDLPAFPDFTNITLNACGAVEAAGDTFEDWVFLTGETGWGVLTLLPQLPTPVAQVLSVHYTQIVTHPLCGLIKLGNMTAVGVLHLPGIFASDGSGVKYFQFGTIADELRVAVLAAGAMAGAIYGLFDDTSAGVHDIQAFTSQVGLVAVDALAFFFEWVPGNVFYFRFQGPLPATWGSRPPAQGGPLIIPYGFPGDFVRYYLVDYYLKAPPLGTPVTLGSYTYASSLAQFFTDAFQMTQALGNLLGLINDPFGQFVRFLVDALLALLKAGANFSSFVYCLLTFQCDQMPITFHNVDFDVFFNNLYYLAGAAGDIIRQFDPGHCAITVTEDQKNIVCCGGDLVEEIIDTAVLVVQQLTHFVQDLLTLPTFQLHLCVFGLYTPTNITQCVRIPDFNTALYELNTAICSFTCALVSIIPTTTVLQCVFLPLPPPVSGKEKQTPPLCAKAQTCIANELCAVLQIFTVPLAITNAFFTKVINGQTFTGFVDFLVFSFDLILGQIALIIDRFGYMIDCLVCAFAGTHVNCSPILYEVLSELTTLIRSTSKIFTQLLLDFVKLVLGLLIGMFGGGNPIKALVDFIVGFLTDIFGGIGTTVVNFITELFDSIGLSFIGDFIQLLWQGFCPLLQLLLNVFIGILNLITFGAFNEKPANFCCSGGNCTISGGSGKRAHDQNGGEAAFWLNTSYWLAQLNERYYQWPPSDPCNTSIAILAQFDWNQLSSDQAGEIEFCLFRWQWAIRTDGQYAIGNSTCDEMILTNQQTPWSSLTTLERGVVRDCLQSRLMTDALRNITNATWLPQDLLTNPWRKYYFGGDLLRGYLIDWQYMSDQQKPVTTVLSSAYQAYWASFGLSTTHYRGVDTADALATMRANVRLCDYFAANNAANCDAVKYTAAGFWGIANRLFQSISNVSLVMSDTESNPAVYLSYNYSLDSMIPVASTAASSILSNVFLLFTTFASYWSQESSYKKRDEGAAQVRLALRIAYNESRRQLRLMAQEFWQQSVHASELRADQCGVGSCDPVDRARAHAAYNRSIHGEDELHGEFSVIYRLSQWWKRTSFQTYAIRAPRYGTNRATYGRNGATMQYRHANGTLVNETRRERAYRVLSLVNQGSPAAQRRWATLGRFWHKIKQSVYHRVLKHHYVPAHVEQVQEANGHTVLRSRNPTALSHEIHCDAARRCTVVLPAAMRPPAAAAAPPEESDAGGIHAAEYASLLFRTADIFDLQCYTNITFTCLPPLVCNGTNTTTLCAQCFYLDQLIGRVTAALDQLLTHYTGGAFAQQVNLTVAFFNYCFDQNARVIVGNSPQNNVNEFPRMGDGSILGGLTANRDYVDDPTPKMGFSDITAAINAALNATNSSNYTLQLSTSDNVIDNTVSWFITTVFPYLVPSLTRLFALFSTDALFSAGESVFFFLIDWFLLCDWLVGDDYSGANKRFSIGETLCMYIFATLVVTYLSTVCFGVNVVSFVTGTSLSLFIFVSTFLSIYSNWAGLCAPGLPVILMDDTLYFLAFTAFAKCSWFWGFLVRATYTNDTCYAPRLWPCWHCRKDLGFNTFIDNVVFFLQQHFPDALQWLRTAATPLYIIYQIPAVNQRVDQFLGIDFSDPAVAARYYGCQWIVTITFNFLNATYFLIIFYMLLYPLSVVGFALAAWIGNWLWPLFLVLFYMLIDLVFMIGSSPYDRIEDPQPSQIVSPPSPTQAHSFGAHRPDGDDDDDDDANAKRRRPLGVKHKSLSSAPQPQRSPPMRFKTRSNALGLSTLSNIVARQLDNWWGDRKRK